MTLNHYFIDGVEYPEIPDPCNGVSPMHKSDRTPNVELFVQLGGEVKPAEHLTDKEQFRVGLDSYLDTLEEQVEALGLSITKKEFKQVAADMMSAGLIAWAKSKEVPDEMIEKVRKDILTMVADASRLDMTWRDIFPKDTSAPVQQTEQVHGELF